MTVFERIKKISKQRGMSLNELGVRIGLSPNSIYHWKQATPTADKIQKIADVLDVSTDYLLGRTEPTKKENRLSNKSTADLDDDDVIFTYQGKKIPPEDLEYMKRILRGGKE